MHEIEPYYRWKSIYSAERDKRSPFYGRTYSEFYFTNTIYNYYIHPQWDTIGSETLYTKLLFADYVNGFCIIEMIGEWNDLLNNDIETFRKEVIDVLLEEGIHKFILLGEYIFNFHVGDDDYYQEWNELSIENGGWIVFLNLRDHVMDEMDKINLTYYVNYGESLNDINWRRFQPQDVCKNIDMFIQNNQTLS